MTEDEMDDQIDGAAMEFGARLRAQHREPDDLALARLRAARRSAVAAMPETDGAWSALPFAVAALLALTVGLGLWTTTLTTTTAMGVSDIIVVQSAPDSELPFGEGDLALLAVGQNVGQVVHCHH